MDVCWEKHCNDKPRIGIRVPNFSSNLSFLSYLIDRNMQMKYILVNGVFNLSNGYHFQPDAHVKFPMLKELKTMSCSFISQSMVEKINKFFRKLTKWNLIDFVHIVYVGQKTSKWRAKKINWNQIKSVRERLVYMQELSTWIKDCKTDHEFEYASHFSWFTVDLHYHQMTSKQ